MCKHRQQLSADEQSQAKNLIFNNKAKPSFGSGLDVQ
jgi:hypothetical protein